MTFIGGAAGRWCRHRHGGGLYCRYHSCRGHSWYSQGAFRNLTFYIIFVDWLIYYFTVDCGGGGGGLASSDGWRSVVLPCVLCVKRRLKCSQYYPSVRGRREARFDLIWFFFLVFFRLLLARFVNYAGHREGWSLGIRQSRKNYLLWVWGKERVTGNGVGRVRYRTVRIFCVYEFKEVPVPPMVLHEVCLLVKDCSAENAWDGILFRLLRSPSAYSACLMTHAKRWVKYSSTCWKRFSLWFQNKTF